ncbi:methionyl-tRNA formyltransferase [Flavobacterium agricola]|uniref:Methionyl-tRNA formyltransferase n=1 Tax=Flavobacterium agricola TaxID=2870839 RepID=A0ABY6M0P2_9FLAO|nr:methionyl-tRNA formyltransferase [Flavobacterium agricola]UYW00443.1 methionyl-tRNA formyltransferase [Flavobacterium agricola]
MEKLRIVFMGTPDFAVGILDAIQQSEHEVVGVVTVADKPAGRGQKVKYSAVKEYALANQLPLLQPTNLKADDFLTQLTALQANLFVVVAFRMLPKVVWALPKLGTFNLHASLLPEYRGAAPINWAVINGDSQTGVTTFFIDNKIDTGEMILSEATLIGPNESAGELHDRLMHLGAQVVLKTLQLIATNNVTTQKQVESANIKTAYKLNRDNCKIDWQKPGIAIHNQIRGLSPYPAAWSFLELNGEELNIKIYEAQFISENHDITTGTIITNKKQIKVAVSGGFVELLSLQLPGKKRMKSYEILNGTTFNSESKVY